MPSHRVSRSPLVAQRRAHVPALLALALLTACDGAESAEGEGGSSTTAEGVSSTGGETSVATGAGGGGGAPSVAAALGLNDVSVLFPFPSGDDAPGYLRADDAGPRGPLLPQTLFDAIPTFPVTPSQGLVYERMRAVGIRFDGCSGGVGSCEPEVRLVMQPVVGGKVRDSALHLFFRFDATEMAEVVSALRGLRELAPETDVTGPLQVHPSLVAQGTEGPYGAALRELVLAHAGEDNLTRMTFFLRAPPANEVWFFGGFERDGDVVTPMDVVGVGTDPQRVILTKTNDTYAYDLTPRGLTPEDGSALLSTAAADAASTDERADAFASFLRVEDPTVYVPDQLPCAGCHLSSYVTAEASRRFGIDAGAFPQRFTSGRDLTMTGGAASNPSSLRAFGWFGDQPMIAQRTINESAAVADDLDARYPSD